MAWKPISLVFASTIATGSVNNAANAQQAIKHVQQLPVLTTDEQDELYTIAKNHPALKTWSADNWDHITTDFLGTENPPEWTHALVHLKLPSTAKAQKFCDIGWEAMVKINLETKQVEDANYPTESNNQCMPTELQKPGDAQVQPTSADEYSFIPKAYALTTSAGYAIARQDDLDDCCFNYYYGNLAYLKTPSVSSTIYSNMNYWAAFLLNAQWTNGK